MLTTHPLPGNPWRERIVGLERRRAAPRRPAGAVCQPRQRGQHSGPPRGARCGAALSAVLLERAPGNGLQVPSQHRAHTTRRTPRSHASSAPTRGPQRSSSGRTPPKRSTSWPSAYPWRRTPGRPLDGDGAPLQRSAVAASRTGRQGGGHTRWTAGRGRRGPVARRLRRAGRVADRQRRLERHRLHPADSPSGAKGARGRGADPGRRRAARPASAHRRQGRGRPRASRLRRAVGAQDVRPVRHRRAGGSAGHLPAGRAGASGRRNRRDRHADRRVLGRRYPIARKPAVPT